MQPFKFACDNDREIENWAENLRLETSRRYIDFKEWKRTGFIRNWAMKTIPILKNSGRLLCYRLEK